MVPNHGLIVHALLHSKDDFALGMEIVNTSGWDTDCNSGNLGCLLGIKNGLKGIDAGPMDWRGPVADRIYVPTADPTWGISDCVRETDAIVAAGHRLAEAPYRPPKQGARFHFAYPGAVQGFTVTEGNGQVSNESAAGRRHLRLTTNATAHFGSPVFAPTKAIAKRFENAGYALLASPLVYPGQIITAQVDSTANTSVALYLSFYGENDSPQRVVSAARRISGRSTLTLAVPSEAHPVFEVGLVLPDGGAVDVDSLTWDGVPTVTLTRPDHRGTMWRRAFVNGMDTFDSRVEPIRVVHNAGRGLLIQGTRDWQDYRVTADITPHLAECVGLAGRVQGMRRYYALQWQRSGELQLVRMLNEVEILASCAYEWSFGETRELALTFERSNIVAAIDGESLLSTEDSALYCGGVALLLEAGRSATEAITVAPVSP